MGWQVLAGVMVRAVRSATGRVVESSMRGPFLELSPLRKRSGGRLGGDVPRGSDEAPHVRVDHAVDLEVEVHRSAESRVGAAVVVVVQLLAGDAHLLDDVLVLDAGAHDGRLVLLDE